MPSSHSPQVWTTQHLLSVCICDTTRGCRSAHTAATQVSSRFCTLPLTCVGAHACLHMKFQGAARPSLRLRSSKTTALPSRLQTEPLSSWPQPTPLWTRSDLYCYAVWNAKGTRGGWGGGRDGTHDPAVARSVFSQVPLTSTCLLPGAESTCSHFAPVYVRTLLTLSTPPTSTPPLCCPLWLFVSPLPPPPTTDPGCAG